MSLNQPQPTEKQSRHRRMRYWLNFRGFLLEQQQTKGEKEMQQVTTEQRLERAKRVSRQITTDEQVERGIAALSSAGLLEAAEEWAGTQILADGTTMTVEDVAFFLSTANRYSVTNITKFKCVDKKDDKGFTDEDRTQLTIIKKLVEGHIASGQIKEIVEAMTSVHSELLEQFSNVTNKFEEVQGELGQHKTIKEWYSPKEVAELLGKASFTVQEWCRLGRVNARKRPTGRGDAKEWEISLEEIERYKNHGLLPTPTKY